MKTLNSKYCALKFIFLTFCACMVCEFSVSSSGMTQTMDSPAPKAKVKNLHITADNLVANQNSQHVVFSGRVVAVYDSTTIKSDKLQVLYSDQAESEEFNKASIETVIATGNVHIEFEGKTAQCDQAVYHTAENNMVLTGDSARIQSENNYITGNKITIYQNTGQIIVDGGETSRVNAVFQPEENHSLTDLK